MIGLLSHSEQVFSDPIEQAFTYIYDKGIWGKNSLGEGTSGGGSSLKATETYRAFLQDFFATHNISSVVDVGCGDWEFSRYINWENIQYTGYDVVASVINKNQKNFSQENICFVHANALTEDLPQADLLICKDVLQHLSNESVILFLEQTNKFKYCLITNDINQNMPTKNNQEISDGSYRRLDLTAPPFNVEGDKIFTYKEGPNTKQVLLMANE
jgi:SAM-dependent methyltransferase